MKGIFVRIFCARNATARGAGLWACGLLPTRFLVARAALGTYFIKERDKKGVACVREDGEEVLEDYALLAGLPAEEVACEPVGKSVAGRLPWLVLLFLLGLLVSGVVGVFERVVEQLSLIVSFQSLILGMAGNAGTQALAVTVRTLSDGTFCHAKKRLVARREALIGLCDGALIGVLSFVLVGLYLYVLRGEAATLAFSVSFCVALALFVAMMLSGLSGAVIPLFLSRIGVDPAVASGPFITTVSDLVAVIAYYGLAWVLLIWRLGA